MASISITAPSSAEEGERVSVSVRVTSTLDYHASYEATIYAVPDRYPDYVIGSIDQPILSGDSVTRDGSFTMPDCNVTVLVWVERWAFDHWTYDGSASKVVSLEIPVPETFHLSVLVPSWAAGGHIDPGSGDYPAYSTVKLTAHPLSGYQFTSWGGDASGTSPTYNLYMNSDKYVEAYFEKVPVPEFKGKIVSIELKYDGLLPIPPTFPIGAESKVYVGGRNDMDTPQQMGISWIIKDPEGFVPVNGEFSYWELWPHPSPGETHRFVGPTFNLDKVGTWRIGIGLYMNPDDPVKVDSYSGVLCDVVELVEVFKGTISKKELEYDGARSVIPVY